MGQGLESEETSFGCGPASDTRRARTNRRTSGPRQVLGPAHGITSTVPDDYRSHPCRTLRTVGVLEGLGTIASRSPSLAADGIVGRRGSFVDGTGALNSGRPRDRQ